MTVDAHAIEVEVTTPVHQTELAESVEAAIEALFPGAEVEQHPGELVATTHSLDRLTELLREQGIVDTARDVFRQNVEADAFAFRLKKQAATEGVVNFAVGSPAELGDLNVRVRVREPSVGAFIDGIGARTPEGG